MSLSMDSSPEPTECQGQRDHYVTGSFWWLWSLTGELVDGFAVSITQSLFKGNLKRAEALVASRFMTGHCWCGLKQEGFTHSFIQTSMSLLSRRGSWSQVKLVKYDFFFHLTTSSNYWSKRILKFSLHLQFILHLGLLPAGDARTTYKGSQIHPHKVPKPPHLPTLTTKEPWHNAHVHVWRFLNNIVECMWVH